MPTKSGKPQAGDRIRHTPSGKILIVDRRGSGETCYTVWAHAEGEPVGKRMLTEFDYWLGRTYEIVKPLTQASLVEHYSKEYKLALINRLAAKWYRHNESVQGRTHDTEFERGMMRAYASTIAEELGLPVVEVEAALADGNV